MSNLISKPAFSFSRYDRTYNNAIDLIAECIGWHRGVDAPIKTIYLNRRYWDLFRAGLEVLMKREIMPDETFQFDSVNIECRKSQFETMTYDYYPLNLRA